MRVVAKPYLYDCDSCGTRTNMMISFTWGDLALCPMCQNQLIAEIAKSFEVSLES